MIGLDASIDGVEELQALAEQGARAIVRATEILAGELRGEHIPAEAPRGRTGALADDWQERQEDPLTRVVFPGARAFYAHMVARGTGAHGPRRARAMTVEGRFAAHVAGQAANPFHERAAERLSRGADAAVDAALRELGVL